MIEILSQVAFFLLMLCVFKHLKKKAPAYTAKFIRDVQRELALKP